MIYCFCRRRCLQEFLKHVLLANIIFDYVLVDLQLTRNYFHTFCSLKDIFYHNCDHNLIISTASKCYEVFINWCDPSCDGLKGKWLSWNLFYLYLFLVFVIHFEKTEIKYYNSVWWHIVGSSLLHHGSCFPRQP